MTLPHRISPVTTDAFLTWLFVFYYIATIHRFVSIVPSAHTLTITTITGIVVRLILLVVIVFTVVCRVIDNRWNNVMILLPCHSICHQRLYLVCRAYPSISPKNKTITSRWVIHQSHRFYRSGTAVNISFRQWRVEFWWFRKSFIPYHCPLDENALGFTLIVNTLNDISIPML
jgi:hypothetical protein